MTNTPTPDNDALEKAWRLLNLQADTMLKWSQNRTEVWKVAVGAFIAGGLVAAITAALTAAMVLRIVDAADDHADCARAVYQSSRAVMIRSDRPTPGYTAVCGGTRQED